MIQFVKTIERKRINKRELGPENLTLCNVELESVRSKGTLLGMNWETRESKVISEASIDTKIFSEPEGSGKYKMPNGKSLSEDGIDKLSSKLIGKLLSKLEIEPEEIDIIAGYSDAFFGFDNPSEASTLFEMALDSCRREIGKEIKISRARTPKIAANEPKSENTARGARSMTKGNSEKSPNCFLDFSTCLSGISFYRKNPKVVSGLFAGLGVEILDALARGYGDLNSENGDMLQLPQEKGDVYEPEVTEFSARAANLIEVQRVPSGRKRVGGVPIDVEESYDQNVKLIGSDAGKNGSDLDKLTEIGRDAAAYGLNTLKKTIDGVFVLFVGKIIKLIYEEQLIDESSGLCISGRNVSSGNRPEMVIDSLQESGFEKIARNTTFLDNPASLGVDFGPSEN